MKMGEKIKIEKFESLKNCCPVLVDNGQQQQREDWEKKILEHWKSDPVYQEENRKEFIGALYNSCSTLNDD